MADCPRGWATNTELVGARGAGPGALRSIPRVARRNPTACVARKIYLPLWVAGDLCFRAESSRETLPAAPRQRAESRLRHDHSLSKNLPSKTSGVDLVYNGSPLQDH